MRGDQECTLAHSGFHVARERQPDGLTCDGEGRVVPPEAPTKARQGPLPARALDICRIHYSTIGEESVEKLELTAKHFTPDNVHCGKFHLRAQNELEREP
jgi:hypothetical protein